jgi:hypothetical protein
VPVPRDPFGLGRYSDELWQRHEVRRQRPSYREIWPDREYFKARWTEASAAALIVADEQIRNEAAGHHDLPPVPYEILDPPAVEHPDWRMTYANELRDAPRVAWPLAQPNPVGALLRRFTRRAEEVRPGEAGLLSPMEAVTLQHWAAGDSFRTISEATGADPRNCRNRVRRAVLKLRAQAGREAVAS